jgi:hypothetical protein
VTYRRGLQREASVSKRSDASAPDVPAAEAPAESRERIYETSELDILPAPAGEPLVDLRAYDDVALDGSIELVLSIDPAGHVVEARLAQATGLPQGVIDVLQQSFSTFPYAPGQIAGRPVHSRVTLSIALREGRALTGANP